VLDSGATASLFAIFLVAGRMNFGGGVAHTRFRRKDTPVLLVAMQH